MSDDAPQAALVKAVMDAVVAFQDSTDHVDEAAAQRLGLNRTDLRCLGIVARAGAITAGQLAAAAQLSPGATTTAVDRLTRAGYARRVRDAHDRRRVTVEATPHADECTEQIWKPIGQESYQRLSRRSAAQLRVILAFLEEGQLLQTEHAARIRAVQPTAAENEKH